MILKVKSVVFESRISFFFFRVRVELARERRDRDRGGRGGGRFDRNRSPNRNRGRNQGGRGNPPGRKTEYRIIVENLSSRTSWQVSILR